MQRSKQSLLAALAISAAFIGARGSQQEGETVTLPPFTDTYCWREFAVSKDAPLSDDGRYRLVGVRKNGNVELIDCAVSTVATTRIIAKPSPRKLKKGEPLPTVVVVSADYRKQFARLKELRVK